MVTANPPLKESEKIERGYAQVDRDQRQSTASKLIIASYNIRYAVGSYLISGGLMRKAGLCDVSRRSDLVAENIRSAAKAFTKGQLLPTVDVLAVQEADKETKRAGRHHVAKEIAEALHMDWIHVPAGLPRGEKPKRRQWWLDFEEPIDLYDPGDTGIGLLSRLPLSDPLRMDLPWHECAWRPRLAMAATISTANQKLRIYNAHVDPHAAIGGQLEQLEVLVSEADKESLPTLIMGDFNTLSNKKVSETRSFLESHGYLTPFSSGTTTWRGMGIRLHADWIFSRGVKIARWGVARPLGVSDHWPVWVEVDLGVM